MIMNNKSSMVAASNVPRTSNMEAPIMLLTVPKQGDSEEAELSVAAQLQGPIIPIVDTPSDTKARMVTDEEKSRSVFRTMRMARANARLIGIRAKRAKQAEADAEMKKTKGK